MTDTMSDDIRQIARKLSQTRRFSVDHACRQKQNIEKVRRKSTAATSNNNVINRNYLETVEFKRSLSDENRPSHQQQLMFQSENIMYPDKIKAWLNKSKELLTIMDKDEEKSVFEMEPDQKSDSNPIQIISEPKSPGSPIAKESARSKLPERLQNELLDNDVILYDVPWDTSQSDLFIEVEDTLFPVEKNFISYVSDKFQELIEESSSIQIAGSLYLSMNDYTLNEIKTALTFIHSSEQVPITDCNVASLLQLGEEFHISRLIYQCEKHLRESKTFNPVIMSHLAKQYRLESLLEYSYSEMSKIEGIEDTQEFQLLDSTAQNHILKFLLKRYKNASKTLSQFDVHLCNHHGSDPKNNECCFRAATYSTENNRIFLVSMEQPEKKLVERYQNALDCDSRILLKSQQKTHLNINNLHNDRFHSV